VVVVKLMDVTMMKKFWISRSPFMSKGKDHLWTPLVDVYWGTGCEETFHVKWMISTHPVAIYWDGKLRIDRGNRGDEASD
jgi:hypothetical protein